MLGVSSNSSLSHSYSVDIIFKIVMLLTYVGHLGQ